MPSRRRAGCPNVARPSGRGRSRRPFGVTSLEELNFGDPDESEDAGLVVSAPEDADTDGAEETEGLADADLPVEAPDEPPADTVQEAPDQPGETEGADESAD